MPASWIVLHLTERCPRTCLHCLRAPGSPPADLPLAVLERVLAQARATHRADHVALTGGEPALHPRFEEVLDVLTRHGYGWHLVTSGAAFDRVLRVLDAEPRVRAALTAVDVSLDGADEATHDGLRGRGSWRDALAAIAASRARDVPVVVQMAVHARNVAQIEQLGLVAAQLGAGRVSFAMTQATGTPRDAALRLDVEGWRAARDRVQRLRSTLAVAVTGADDWEVPQPFQACEALRGELLHVDPRGRLTLCCQHSGVPGAERGVVADLAEVPLVEAHRRLLDAGHRVQRAKLAAMEAGALDGFDLFPCNWCMQHLGMPHWTRTGGAGALGAAAEARR